MSAVHELSLAEEIREIGKRARAASRPLANLSTDTKNKILHAMADALLDAAPAIIAANRVDFAAAEAKGTTSASLDRLHLDPARITRIADALRDVAALPDPVGGIITEWTRPNGIHISKVRKPIGVIGMIYESRPNVTADAAALCIKTGNAVILRGGSESLRSNSEIATALQRGGASAGLPDGAVQLITTPDRAAVKLMAEADEFIDVLIPRGGHQLIEAVVSAARMPVIKHYNGVCHLFIDRAADLEMATEITINSKCQRPGVCNALETLLIDEAVAGAAIARLAPDLIREKVEIRADPAAFAHFAKLGYPKLKAAVPSDWGEEYLDLILAVKVVPSVEAAMDHIEQYGSRHSDAIITSDSTTAEQFLNEVDSATVYWNASTRFTDGGEFGFGAEIGISTDKLHPRGPVGLEELTTYRYLIRGDGQIR